MADVNKAQSLGFRSRPIKRTPADLTNAEKNSANLPDSESKQERQMQALALKTVGVIFLLVSFLHLLRLIFRIKVMVGKFTVPVWFSAVGFIIPLLLSFWIFEIYTIAHF